MSVFYPEINATNLIKKKLIVPQQKTSTGSISFSEGILKGNLFTLISRELVCFGRPGTFGFPGHYPGAGHVMREIILYFTQFRGLRVRALRGHIGVGWIVYDLKY